MPPSAPLPHLRSPAPGGGLLDAEAHVEGGHGLPARLVQRQQQVRHYLDPGQPPRHR